MAFYVHSNEFVEHIDARNSEMEWCDWFVSTNF
jgi:hypothetical protein